MSEPPSFIHWFYLSGGRCKPPSSFNTVSAKGPPPVPTEAPQGKEGWTEQVQRKQMLVPEFYFWGVGREKKELEVGGMLRNSPGPSGVQWRRVVGTRTLGPGPKGVFLGSSETGDSELSSPSEDSGLFGFQVQGQLLGVGRERWVMGWNLSSPEGGEVTGVGGRKTDQLPPPSPSSAPRGLEEQGAGR